VTLVRQAFSKFASSLADLMIANGLTRDDLNASSRFACGDKAQVAKMDFLLKTLYMYVHHPANHSLTQIASKDPENGIRYAGNHETLHRIFYSSSTCSPSFQL
jgi:hypothetical protein